MTNESKTIEGLDKDLMQLIDAEMKDPVLSKLLNRNAAYVLGKEIKLMLLDKVVDWLEEHVPTKFEDMVNYVEQFKQDFEL